MLVVQLLLISSAIAPTPAQTYRYKHRSVFVFSQYARFSKLSTESADI
jgi:hypothetical protein